MTFSSVVLLILVVFYIYRTFLEPYPRFVVEAPIDLDDSEAAARLAEISNGTIADGNSIEVLRNGDRFYPAMLDAMRVAKFSINIEVYIFHQGKIGEALSEVLCERARAGIRVRVLADGFGSFRLAIQRKLLRRLREAGCEVHFYHFPSPLRVEVLNTRTHRDLMVIDGQRAFTGGAGIADHWLMKTRRGAQWRDSMFRIEGPAVAAIQGIFIQDWMEVSEKILTAETDLPRLLAAGSQSCLVVESSGRWGTSPARILHHTLLASARRKIQLSTPYFLPDSSIMKQLESAAVRGIEITIITTSKNTDEAMTRAGSRRLFGRLLRAGVRIHEFQPGMYHVKTLIIDDQWGVFGTANFDNRSLSINDEISVATNDATVMARLSENFRQDLGDSLEISLKEWRNRPWIERAYAQFSRILERQQ